MEEEAKSFKAILTALDEIKKLRPNFGSIECPMCKGKLDYKRHTNGHVHGRCNTDNCLSWMQ